MTKLLSEKTAVVSGCNRGIGRSILETFAQEGADIIACVRSENKEFSDFIDKISLETNVSILPVYFDFEELDQVKSAVKTIHSMKKNIDILVNNAAVATGSIVQMTSMRELDKTLKINFTSQIMFTQGILKQMIRNKNGSIINVASISGILGMRGTLSYGSSKAALIFATKTMSSELGIYNIRVNSIAPNVVKTDMYDKMDEKERDKLIESSALKRAGEPFEIANAALFLASELSSYITGQVLRVDGGLIS